MNLPASDGVAHLELAAGVHTEPDDLIGQRVAHNLLRLRGKRNLSLDALARISGVSRAMLAQIRRLDPVLRRPAAQLPQPRR